MCWNASAYYLGKDAFRAGKSSRCVPYVEGSIEWTHWINGWFDAQTARDVFNDPIIPKPTCVED